MKTKFKVLVVMLVAICITGMSTVLNATTEFSNKNVTVTLDKDLEVNGTTEAIFSEKDSGSVYHFNVNVTGVSQKDINEYASTEKTYNAEIRIPLSEMEISFDDVKEWYVQEIDENSKATWEEITQNPIEEVEGKKYLVLSQKISYFPDNEDVKTYNDNKDVMKACVTRGYYNYSKKVRNKTLWI